MFFSVDKPHFIHPLSHASLYKLLLEGLFFILVGDYPRVVGLLVAMVIFVVYVLWNCHCFLYQSHHFSLLSGFQGLL